MHLCFVSPYRLWHLVPVNIWTDTYLIIESSHSEYIVGYMVGVYLFDLNLYIL